MRMACRSCGTEYEIPEDALYRPRRLRCGVCGSEWSWAGHAALAEADAGEREARPAFGLNERFDPDAVPDGQADPVPPHREPPSAGTEAERPGPMSAESFRRLADASRMPASPPGGLASRLAGGTGWLAAWAATVLVLAVAIWAWWHWRGWVLRQWPPSFWLYRLLPHGIPRG
ncbi:hypothetical protein [Rhizosaccharibacter radicis]|uniref:Zinc-ribbon domain-containing protein n=1 Tax=Rhizosaccharibacter radicis TaxID=2782605 RepID=A0ABT1VX81_9PROT|nr:zinc-ribbon domain-containing protein [Acetobacteraceae bacterium KSS12]